MERSKQLSQQYISFVFPFAETRSVMWRQLIERDVPPDLPPSNVQCWEWLKSDDFVKKFPTLIDFDLFRLKKAE